MKVEAKIKRTYSSGKILATANVTIDDCFGVRGVKIIDSSKGIFVSMPNTKVGEHYVDTCFPITRDARILLENSVLGAWQQYQEQHQQQQPQQSQQTTPAYEPESFVMSM